MNYKILSFGCMAFVLFVWVSWFCFLFFSFLFKNFLFGYSTQEYVGQAHTTCSALVNNLDLLSLLHQFVFLPDFCLFLCHRSIVRTMTKNFPGLKLIWERKTMEVSQIFCSFCSFDLHLSPYLQREREVEAHTHIFISIDKYIYHIFYN